MKMALDNENLRELLKGRKKYIRTPRQACRSLFSFSVPLLLSLSCTNFKAIGAISSEITKGIYIAISTITFVLAIIFWIISLLPRKRYNYQRLYDEILELSKSHNFAVIAIKNNDTNKYLLCKNKRWKNCKLFIGYKLSDTGNALAYIPNIKKKIAETFDVSKKDITINFKEDFESKKYSQSDRTDKLYHFYIYTVKIENIPKTFEASKFKFKDKQYYWMTMNEILSDKKIMKMNSDVVERIRVLNNTV